MDVVCRSRQVAATKVCESGRRGKTWRYQLVPVVFASNFACVVESSCTGGDQFTQDDERVCMYLGNLVPLHASASRASAACSIDPLARTRAARALSASKPMLTNSLTALETDAAADESGRACTSVQYRAVASHAARFVLYCDATSASCGSSGSGADNKAWSDTNAVLTVMAGDHSSLRMSRQMAPVCRGHGESLCDRPRDCMPQ